MKINIRLPLLFSHNFTIMKRRNAFWNLDCSTEGLAGGNQPHSPQIHSTAAAAAAVVAASHQAGIFASLVNVNGIGIGLSAGMMLSLSHTFFV